MYCSTRQEVFAPGPALHPVSVAGYRALRCEGLTSLPVKAGRCEKENKRNDSTDNNNSNNNNNSKNNKHTNKSKKTKNDNNNNNNNN